MTLRIGQIELNAHQLPWATLAVFLAVAVGFGAATTLGPRPAPNDSEERLERATDYWREHAYLIAEPEILIRIGTDLDLGARAARLEELRHDAYAHWPSEEEVRADEQAELDDLTRTALAPAPRDWRRGLVPAELFAPDLATHPLAHRGWVHLAGNLLLLLLAGAILEARWGPLLTGGLIVATTFAGGGFYAVMAPGASFPLSGIDALLAALVGTCAVRFARGIQVPHPGRPAPLEVPVWALVGLWLATLSVQGWLAGGVAYQACFGGLLLGVGASVAVRDLELERRFGAGPPAPKKTGPSELELARRAHQQGDVERELELLAGAAKVSPDDPEVVLEFWERARETPRRDSAARAMLRVIKVWVERGELAQAARHWLTVTETSPRALADPASLVRLAPALITLGDSPAALRALQQAIDSRNKGLTADVALRAATEARELDPDTAVAAARTALQFPDLDSFQRARLQELIERHTPKPAEGEAAEPAVAPEAVSPARATTVKTPAQPVARADEPEPAEVDVIEAEPEALEPEPAVAAATPDEPQSATPEAEPVVSAPATVLEAEPELEPEVEADVELDVEPELEAEAEGVPAPTAAHAAPAVTQADPEEMPERMEPESDGAEASPAVPDPAPSEPEPATPEPTIAEPVVAEPAVPESEPEIVEPVIPDLQPAVAGPEPAVAEPAVAEPEPAVPQPAVSAPAEEAPAEGAAPDGPAPVLEVDPADLDLEMVPEPEEPPAPAPQELEVAAEPTPTPGESGTDEPEPVSAEQVPPVLDSSAAPRFSGLKLIEGVPDQLGDSALTVRLPDGRRFEVEYAKIQALAAAGVRDLAEKLVVIVDLALNWNDLGEGPLQIVRMRSDRFDPRDLVGHAVSLAEAFRVFLHELLSVSNAVPLPDPDGARGLPMAVFDELETYQRDVLEVGGS